jgi:hypothetical protein
MRLVEKAMGKSLQRDVAEGHPEEATAQFDITDAVVVPDQESDDDAVMA